jgi:hypothetical protein
MIYSKNPVKIVQSIGLYSQFPYKKLYFIYMGKSQSDRNYIFFSILSKNIKNAEKTLYNYFKISLAITSF